MTPNNPNNPRISIIILNWNGLKDTEECLQSLQRVVYPNYEVLVVDNGSKGDDAKILTQKYGNYISIIQNKANLGFAAGNNVALEKVLAEKKSKYVLLLNNDTIVDPELLSKLVKSAEYDDKIGIVGPAIYYYDKPTEIHSLGGVVNYHNSHFVGRSRRGEKYDPQQELHYYSGCCMLIRGSVLDEVGLFDPIYFYYNEDIDLGYRICQAGYKIIANPQAKIWHKEGESVGGNIRNHFTAFYEERNRLIFVKKHWGLLGQIAFVPLHFTRLMTTLLKNFSSEKKLIVSRIKGTFYGLFNPNKHKFGLTKKTS